MGEELDTLPRRRPPHLPGHGVAGSYSGAQIDHIPEHGFCAARAAAAAEVEVRVVGGGAVRILAALFEGKPVSECVDFVGKNYHVGVQPFGCCGRRRCQEDPRHHR